MRTRKSTQGKRYAAPDYGLDTDATDTPRALSDDEEGEAAYDAEGASVVEEEDDESDDGLDEEAMDEPIPKIKREGIKRQQRPSLRRHIKSMALTHDPTNLVPYPTDSRLTSTRLYHGIFQKLLRAYFYEDFYGPGEDAVDAAVNIFSRWSTYEVLPSKLLDESRCPIPTPWVPSDFESVQTSTLGDWHERYRDAASQGFVSAQHTRAVSEDQARPYLIPQERELAVLLGPNDSRQQRLLGRNHPVGFDESGASVQNQQGGQAQPLNGWMFDVGGLVVSLAWAPRIGRQTQVLALAVNPFTDQDFDAFENVEILPDDQYSHGSVQLWTFQADEPMDGPCEPSPHPPRLVCTLLLDWGRATRLLWCPASPSPQDDFIGLLGVMGADGMVRVIRVNKSMVEGSGSYEKLETPMVSLGFPDEDRITITCFAWVGINRIVTGQNDGSIALWSLYPNECLFRHAVHHSHVLHIATGYPSHPYLVASHPVSGFSTLFDLSNPGAQVTTTTNPAITPHHSMLEWCDHLQGFISALPSSKPLNTAVGLFHSRTFSTTPRKVIEGDALLSAISVGIHHPFVLAALLDGSVWTCNPMNRTFLPRHAPPGWKLKVFQHEHVPRARFTAPDPIHQEPRDEALRSSRGISRIVQGFKPTVNQGLKALEFAATGTNSGPKSKRKDREAKPKKKPRHPTRDGPDQAAGVEDGDEGGMYADPSKLVVQEPLSRVMTMAWNPNLDFATWAAFGVASGLVRVQNIGVGH